MHLFIKLLPLVNVIMDILMSCFIPLHDKYFFFFIEGNKSFKWWRWGDAGNLHYSKSTKCYSLKITVRQCLSVSLLNGPYDTINTWP